MEFEYKCPKCGKVEIFKSQKTVDCKIANNELCQNCKAKEKQASEHYSRLCPQCEKEIVIHNAKQELKWLALKKNDHFKSQISIAKGEFIQLCFVSSHILQQRSYLI